MPDAARTGVAGRCATCGRGDMRIVSSEREPLMGELGPQIDTLQCSNPECGHSESRIHGT
jgi:hypothetical protein